MARPQKRGLDYFPLDVDIDQDDKIQLVEALHGMTGFSVVIKLLMRIYKEGYYYEWGEMEQLLFSRRVNVDINTLNDIVNDCIKYGIFDKKIYETYKVLTSVGIQERYFEATKRRKNVTVVNQYMLINDLEKVNVNISRVNVDINGDIVDSVSTETPQSKVKESKVKESKGEESKESPKNERPKVSNEKIVSLEFEKEKTTPTTTPIFPDREFGEVVQIFEANLCMLSPIQQQSLGFWFDDFNQNKEVFIEAIKIAADRNRKNYGFVEYLLKEWSNNKLTTVEQIQSHERNGLEKRRRTNQGGYSRQAKEGLVPEWFEERKEPVDQKQNNEPEKDLDIEERRRALRESLSRTSKIKPS